MAVLDYPIYDTALFGTTANTKHTLFQTGQGASSAKGDTITNMRGSGQFPDREAFTVKRIGVHIDDIGLSDDDIQGLFMGSLLTVNYNNVKIMQAPLYIFSDKNSVSGIKTEASATAFDYFGQEGDGYMLTKDFTIQGGKSFNVEVLQGLALDSANMDVKVTLFGLLDTPDITV